jgi:hypothetical protein
LPPLFPVIANSQPSGSKPPAGSGYRWLKVSYLSVAVAGFSAIWVTHTGTLPGTQNPIIAVGIQAVLWALLYAALDRVYRSVSPPDFDSEARVFARLGACIPLALISTYICKRVLDEVSGRSTWSDLFYLRWFLPPVFLFVWCSALLWPQTRAILARYRRSKSLGQASKACLLLASAVILVSCSDMAFLFQQGGGAVQARLNTDTIWVRAWALNVLILFSGYLLGFAATRRVSAALLAVSPWYILLDAATLVKIKYMHSAVQPLDLLRLPEILPLLRSFLGTAELAGIVVALCVWTGALVAALRSGPTEISRARRWQIALSAVAVLATFPAAVFLTRSVPRLSEVLEVAGIPTGQQREQARRHGLLLSFLSEVPSAFVFPPANYSAEVVARTSSKYRRAAAAGLKAAPERRANLILYLVESLMDPADLGLHYTSDPIPTLRKLRSQHIGGYGIVPERFGGSANTEFEALTGMSTVFLPKGSVPYRQYVEHELPSLPNALRSLGYRTTAIQADPKYYYNREWVYNLLGFDTVVWLREVPGVEHAVLSHWPSDPEVVKAVIQASLVHQPFFVFAFPSSTHAPYNSGAYRRSELGVQGAPPGYPSREIQEYINRLRVADHALGVLIEHFKHRSEPTVIAVLGDHLPPLSEAALQPFFRSLAHKSRAEQERLIHRVPLMVWSNFTLPREEKELSVNALPAYLLRKMGAAPLEFMGVSDAVTRELPVLASYVRAADGTVWDWTSLPAQKQALIEDYRLIQYDVLLGSQFSIVGTRANFEKR